MERHMRGCWRRDLSRMAARIGGRFRIRRRKNQK